MNAMGAGPVEFLTTALLWWLVVSVGFSVLALLFAWVVDRWATRNGWGRCSCGRRARVEDAFLCQGCVGSLSAAWREREEQG